MKTTTNNKKANAIIKRSAVSKDLRSAKKQEIKEDAYSLSRCLSIIKEHWTGEFAKQVAEYGLSIDKLTPRFIIDNLNNVDFGKKRENYYVYDGKFVTYNKDVNGFILKEKFSAVYVFNLLIKIANINFRKNWQKAKATAKEVAKERKSK